jgi:hypothetical protein
MTRARPSPAVGAVAIAGLLVGAILTLVVTDGSPSASNAPSAPATTNSSTGSPSGEATASVLLVWTAGGLPPGLASAITALPDVEASTVVKGGQADLVRTVDSTRQIIDETESDWAIPIDALAIDPSTFDGFVGRDSRPLVAALRPGGALLTESSAALRRLDIGSTVELDTGPVHVTGIIDDVSGAGAELIVHVSDARRLALDTERYVLIEHAPGQRQALSTSIAELAHPTAARFRSPTETTWLRHGDAVIPQLFVKKTYGEFAYRDSSGRDIEISRSFVDRHIVTADVPLLGPVRCHRATIAPLAAALTQLAEANLGHLVERAGYAGCWFPRRIGPDEPVSRHAWGIAVDLNIGANPRGSFSSQDPRLVDVMRSAGFTWGGTWLVPDPGHYELLAPA